MAENKKSFIAYADWKGTFDSLPDEVAGKLIKHIFAYVNDENPTTDDYVVNALFEQIKATLKRDLVKWEGQRQQRSLAGKRSAKARATKSNDRSTTVNETERNPTVSVNGNVNVNVNGSDSVNEKTKDNTLLSQVDKSTLDHKDFNYYEIAISFMELFKSNLLELNLSTKTLESAKYKTWVNPVRLLMETDNRTIEEFREVFQFIKADDFWKQQIRSTDKLRKKDKEGTSYFEVLLIKSRNEQKRKSVSEESKSGVTDAYKQSIYNRLHGIKSNEEMPQN